MNFTQLLQLLFHARFLLGIGEIQQIAHVAIVRGRLAEVIKARPNEFARDVGEFVLASELAVRNSRPTWREKIVRTHLEVVLAIILVFTDGEEVLATRADTGGGFTAEERQRLIGRAGRAVFFRFLIIA